MFEIVWDEVDEIIRIVTSGFWTVEKVEAYILELNRAIEKARAKRVSVRVLIDAREAETQSGDVIARLESAPQWMCDEGDRLVVIVGSTLLKMQVKRTFLDDRSQAFLDEAVAEKWLKGDES